MDKEFDFWELGSVYIGYETKHIPICNLDGFGISPDGNTRAITVVV